MLLVIRLLKRALSVFKCCFGIGNTEVVYHTLLNRRPSASCVEVKAFHKSINRRCLFGGESFHSESLLIRLHLS